MVKTGVTIAGGLLSAVGAGLMVGVALMETFVVVTVPETGTCGDKATSIAQIGVYKSSYDPACAEGTQVYEEKYRFIEKIESQDTLEFPLLFPSQAAYGGALGEVDQFESCEKAWALGGSLDEASLRTAAKGFFSVVDKSLRENEEVVAGKALLSAFVNGIDSEVAPQPPLTTLLNGVVTGLWKTNVEENIIQGFLVASNAIITLAQGCQANATRVASGDFTATCTDSQYTGLSVHQYLLLKYQEGGPFEAVLGYYALTFAAAGAPSAYKGVLGIDRSKELEDQDFSVIKGALASQVATGDEEAKAKAQPGLTLLNMCAQGTRTKECSIYDISAAEISATSTKSDNLCTLMQLDAAKAAQANETATFPGSQVLIPKLLQGQPCNYNDAATVLLQNIPTLIAEADLKAPGDLPQEQFLGLAGYLVAKLSSVKCSLNTVGECVDDLNKQIEADFNGVPNNLLNDDWLPAVLSGAQNVIVLFVNIAATAEDAADAEKAGATAFVMNACVGATFFNRTACAENLPTILNGAIQSNDAFTKGNAVKIRAGLVKGASTSLLEGETEEQRIKSCNDDVKDIEVFETAQMMVPAAIGCVSAGVLVSIIAVVTKKMPVALVAGILSVVGGGILFGALLYIQSEAPVYQKLKESADKGEVAGELFYQGGMAQLLALAGVGASLVGGLTTVGSAFCAGSEESEGAITAKVDGTY